MFESLKRRTKNSVRRETIKQEQVSQLQDFESKLKEEALFKPTTLQTQNNLSELLAEPQKKKLVVPDRATQLAKLKQLKQGKTEHLSENQIKQEDEQDLIDSERVGVDFTKFAKKHTLGDLEHKMLYRTSMLQEQIDHLIKYQE